MCVCPLHNRICSTRTFLLVCVCIYTYVYISASASLAGCTFHCNCISAGPFVHYKMQKPTHAHIYVVPNKINFPQNIYAFAERDKQQHPSAINKITGSFFFFNFYTYLIYFLFVPPSTSYRSNFLGVAPPKTEISIVKIT